MNATQTITCTCGATGCQNVVIEIAETRLAVARTKRERTAMVHNYVQQRNLFALKGVVRIVQG